VSTAPTHDRLVEALGPVVAAHGLDLEGVDVTPAGRRRLLRVVVDKDGGVTLDEISEATRSVSRHLDDQDLMDERPYTLEVTSPGTDRPLTQPRHWRRNTGRLVKITLLDGASVVGRIRDTSAERVRIDVAGSDREIGYADVAKALVQVEFNREEA
jgi:ribosome maturation factor RimP